MTCIELSAHANFFQDSWECLPRHVWTYKKVRKPKPSTTWCSVVLQKALLLPSFPSPLLNFVHFPPLLQNKKKHIHIVGKKKIAMLHGLWGHLHGSRLVSGTCLKPPHRGIAQRQWKQQSIQGMGSKESPLQLRHKPQMLMPLALPTVWW